MKTVKGQVLIDTNVLIYATLEDDPRFARSRDLLLSAGDSERYVSVQNLAEMYPSLTGPKMETPDQPSVARPKIQSIASWPTLQVLPLTGDVQLASVMRTAVIADIHGNSPALRAVLEDVRTCGCRQLLFLGDVINGPDPRGSLELLLGWPEVQCIQGNAEWYLCTEGLEEFPWRDQQGVPLAHSRALRLAGGDRSAAPVAGLGLALRDGPWWSMDAAFVAAGAGECRYRTGRAAAALPPSHRPRLRVSAWLS